MFMKRFAQKLKELRKEKDMTQCTVAKELYIGRKTWSNYENSLREPSLETLKKICLYFEISADYLLGISEEKYL